MLFFQNKHKTHPEKCGDGLVPIQFNQVLLIVVCHVILAEKGILMPLLITQIKSKYGK